MPTQAHLFVGIPINDKADLLRAAQVFGVTPPPPQDQDDLEAWDAVFTTQITVEGKQYTPEIYWDSDSGAEWPPNAPSTNALTGQTGDTYVLLGVALTSRYSPSIVDEGWNRGGRPEPFVLDLNRLATIRGAVRQTWAEAEVLMMDFNH